MMPVEKNYSNNNGVILLAAGESSRLGTLKQLLPYAGQTLLQHSLHAAIVSGAHNIVVVLGADADILKEEIKSNNVNVVINTEWQEGIASSIRYGIKTLLRINPFVEGTVLMLCDQPHVTSALINNLMITYQQTGKLIVACNYGNTFGPPVFFHKKIFPELLMLTGNVGAKSLISKHADDVEFVLFPEGSIDVDTEADYQKLSTDTRES
jgi:molybdenum cofactor cytidylyltransferase